MRRSIRKHVNPLGNYFLSKRAQLLKKPQHLPNDCRVEVELGCADGEFSFALAEQNPDWWVVGLDIRRPCIQRNQQKAQTQGLKNLLFAYTNLNVDMDAVFRPRSVHRFHLLFPDPWFKSRHKKRRVISSQLCQTLAQQLCVGGELHIASDVFEVALEIMAEIETINHEVGIKFVNLAGPWSFMRTQPLEITSRREKLTQARNQRVWRMCYQLKE